MFSILNSPLKTLIKHSYALQQKLSPAQMQKFLEKSELLPEEKQEELKQILLREQKTLKEFQKKQERDFQQEASSLLKKEKKELENQIQKNESEYAENILNALT